MSCQLQTDQKNLFANRAFAYGDGVFESIRVTAGHAPLWVLHWQRLCRGGQRLGLDLPDCAETWHAIESVLESAALPPKKNISGVLKLVLYRQSKGVLRGYCPEGGDSALAIQFFPAGQSHQAAPTAKLRVMKCTMRLARQPALAGIKHLNRLENVLACQEVRQAGYDDGLLLDADDNLVEATSSNLVMLQGSEWITPDLSGCGVQGVALSWLQAHFPVASRVLPYAQITQMDALLLCNSIRGFRVAASAGPVCFNRSLQKSVVQQRISEIMTAWEALFLPE